MKKISIFIVLFCITLLIVLVIHKLNGLDLKEKSEIEINNSEVRGIPLFEFFDLEGNIYSKYDLQKNRSTIIVYFDPDCSSCKKSGDIFSKFRSIHKDSQVLFVTSSSPDRVKAYIKEHRLGQIQNVNFYTVMFDDFYNFFKESKTPSYIYFNSNGDHIKTINEEVPVKIILRYIKAAQANE